MNGTTLHGSVAIDTNVFEHLTNPQENPEQHIDGLLEYLISWRTELLVDGRNRINGEYNNRIVQKLKNSYETDNAASILKYWFIYATHRKIELKLNDRLMESIKRIIHEHTNRVDTIFVYVAFKEGKILISNDINDIVDGPPSERGHSPRRTRLQNATKKHRPNGAGILTSIEANDLVKN